MDRFGEAELKGRKIFNDLLLKNDKNNNIEFTKDKFEKVDVFWDKNNKKNVGEIKYRNYNSDVKFIENEGLLLEKSKYDELKRIEAESGMTAFYINIMKDDVIYLFDLTEINNPKWIEEENKYPIDSQYNKEKKIKKVVTYLKPNLAKKIKIKGNS